MNFAAWAPAIITAITCVFIAGQYRQTISDHSRRLDGLDLKVDDLSDRMTASEAWTEGYNAARSK